MSINNPYTRKFTLDETPNFPLQNYERNTELINKISNLNKTESVLLKKYYSSKLIRKERSKLVPIVKIVQFWMKNKIKRGEGLNLLVNYLKKFPRPTDENSKMVKKIPELPVAFKLLDELTDIKKNGGFTPDDYYLTIEEQFEFCFIFLIFFRKMWKSYYENSKTGKVSKEYYIEHEEFQKEIEKNALKKGNKIIHFELKNGLGELVSTSELLKKGPIMCVLNDSIPQFDALGATIISLAPDLSSYNYFHKLGTVGEILIDKNSKVADKWKLRYKCGPIKIQVCKDFDFKVWDFNGENEDECVVDMDGTIALSYVKNDYYIRLEPLKIVECLYELFAKREKTKIEDISEVEIEKKEDLILGKRMRENYENESLDGVIDEDRVKKRRKIVPFDHRNFI